MLTLAGGDRGRGSGRGGRALLDVFHGNCWDRLLEGTEGEGVEKEERLLHDSTYCSA